MNVTAFCRSISDQRTRDMLVKKLNGSTLESLSKEYYLTSERIRKIIQTAVTTKAVTLEEEKYLPAMSMFRLSLDDFVCAFDETPQVYRFLNLLSKKRGAEKLSAQSLAKADFLSPEIRTGLEKLLFEDKIFVDGTYIPKTKTAIAEEIGRRFCSEAIPLDLFYEKYRDFLKEHNLSDDKSLQVANQDKLFCVSSENYILFSFDTQVRYYDLRLYDFSRLMSSLQLDRYNDTVYSSNWFFRQHTDLMKEYDIQNEFELHRLLRCLCPRYGLDHISFGRMPTIRFGNKDPQTQACDFIRSHAPITQQEAFRLYENAYGINLKTNPSLTASLAPYYHAGQYIFSPTLPSADNITHMKDSLEKDVYTLQELQLLYCSMFPNGDPEDISPTALKKNGFLVLQDYVIHFKYRFIIEYFRSLLTSGDTVDLSYIPNQFTSRQDFKRLLHQMEIGLDLVEFAKGKYYTAQGLQRLGVEKRELFLFGDETIWDIPGEKYFTVPWLRKHGFNIPDLPIPDNAFSSVLYRNTSHIQSTWFGGQRLLRFSPASASVNGFLCSVLEEIGPVSLDDLVAYLDAAYGIQQKRSCLAARIRSCGLYCDEAGKIVPTTPGGK